MRAGRHYHKVITKFKHEQQTEGAYEVSKRSLSLRTKVGHKNHVSNFTRPCISQTGYPNASIKGQPRNKSITVFYRSIGPKTSHPIMFVGDVYFSNYAHGSFKQKTSKTQPMPSLSSSSPSPCLYELESDT